MAAAIAAALGGVTLAMFISEARGLCDEDTDEAPLLLSPRRGVRRGLTLGGRVDEVGVDVEVT